MITIALLLLVHGADCTGVPAGHVAAVESLAVVDVGNAIARSRRVRDRSPQCADAHLAYAMALNRRLQESGGITALRLSREYRGVLDRVLALDSTSLRARMERIEFLMYAPSIAGGSAERARLDIVALSRLTPVEAARLAVELERRAGSAMARRSSATRSWRRPTRR